MFVIASAKDKQVDGNEMGSPQFPKKSSTWVKKKLRIRPSMNLLNKFIGCRLHCIVCTRLTHSPVKTRNKLEWDRLKSRHEADVT